MSRKLARALFAITTLLLLLPAEVHARPQCIAHRGNSPEFLENSLAALNSAVELGAGAEFDIHHTRDGVAILLHDSRLGHTVTSRPGEQCPLGREIKKLRFDEIRASCQLTNGEPVPSLREALEVLNTPDTTILLEMKDNPSKSTLRLLDEFYRSRPERLRVVSFKLTALWLTFQKLPTLTDNGAKLFHSSGNPWLVSPFFHGVDLKKPGRSWVRWFKRLGLEVSVFNVNSPSDLERYIKLGAHYITTDNPRACVGILGR